MANTAKELQKKLEIYHVLNHAYYQAWNAGELKKESLELYARQYFHHVDAFPRYISATHSNCSDIKARQFLLENLNDEEKGEENHPELWMQFAEGLGNTREAVKSEQLLPETKALIDTLMGLSRSSFEEGLGALFAYEHQVPEVAKTKIEGLIKHYGISDEKTLKFFKVHEVADVYHSKVVAEIYESLSEEQRAKVDAGAETAAKALWNFLSGICKACDQEFANCELPSQSVAA